MSARIPFFLINSGNTLLTTADKIDIYKISAPTVIVASTDPSGEQLQIYDNHDGVYYIEASNADFPTDKYLAKVNSINQKELYNVILINDDLIEHLNNSTKHREIDDSGTAATDLLSAEKIIALNALKISIDDIIDNLTSTDTDKPLSAKQGKALQDNKAASSHEHDAADVNITDTGDLITATEVEAALQEIFSQVGSIDFSGITLLDEPEGLDLTQALKNLNAQIVANLRAITQGTEIFNRRSIYSSVGIKIAAGLADTVIFEETSSSYVIKITGSFYKVDGDKYIKLHCEKRNDDATKVTSVKFTAYPGTKEDVVDYDNISWHEVDLIVDISSNTTGLCFFTVELKTSAGTGEKAHLMNVNIEITGI